MKRLLLAMMLLVLCSCTTIHKAARIPICAIYDSCMKRCDRMQDRFSKASCGHQCRAGDIYANMGCYVSEE